MGELWKNHAKMFKTCYSFGEAGSFRMQETGWREHSCTCSSSKLGKREKNPIVISAGNAFSAGQMCPRGSLAAPVMVQMIGLAGVCIFISFLSF